MAVVATPLHTATAVPVATALGSAGLTPEQRTRRDHFSRLCALIDNAEPESHRDYHTLSFNDVITGRTYKPLKVYLPSAEEERPATRTDLGSLHMMLYGAREMTVSDLAVTRLLSPSGPKYNAQLSAFVEDYAVAAGKIRKTVQVPDLLKVLACFPDTELGALCREFNDSMGSAVLTGDQDVARMAEERRDAIQANPNSLGGSMAAETGLLSQQIQRAIEEDEEERILRKRKLEAEANQLEIANREKEFEMAKATRKYLDDAKVLDSKTNTMILNTIKRKVVGMVPSMMPEAPEGCFLLRSEIARLGYACKNGDEGGIGSQLSSWYKRETGDRPRTIGPRSNPMCYYENQFLPQAQTYIHEWFAGRNQNES